MGAADSRDSLLAESIEFIFQSILIVMLRGTIENGNQKLYDKGGDDRCVL